MSRRVQLRRTGRSFNGDTYQVTLYRPGHMPYTWPGFTEPGGPVTDLRVDKAIGFIDRAARAVANATQG